MSRPQRQHKAPQRFGTFASEKEAAVADMPESEHESEEDEEEVPARRRVVQRQKRRRQREEQEDDEEGDSEAERPPPRKKAAKRKAAAVTEEEEEEESGSDSEDESSEEENEHRAAPAQRRVRKAAPFVPPPPAEPRSRSDMLSLLFACPALIDALLEPDGLRTITLVARDAAHLATSLCARTGEMAGLWQQLARRCDPRLPGNAIASDALAVVRRAILADPARSQTLNTTTAESEYRVTRKELQGLSYSTRYSQSFWASTVKMFSKLDVLAIAHRKWGHIAVLEEQRAAARERSARAKEARQGKAAQREKEMAKALTRAGLEGPKSRRHGRLGRRQIKAYLKRGEGDVAVIVDAIKKENDRVEGQQKRRTEMLTRLRAEGLNDQLWSNTAQCYILGTAGKQTLAQAVAAIKRAKTEADARTARRTRIVQLLTEEGMQAYLPGQYAGAGGAGGWGGWAAYNQSRVPGLTSYVESGEGSEDAVLAAARALREQEEAKEQRRAAVQAAFVAEGLQQYNNSYLLPGLTGFIERNEGSVEELAAAARQVRLRSEERQARRTRIRELLAAEGLEEHEWLDEVAAFVRGEGSEAEALAAARAVAQQAAERTERRAALTAALAAEGIELVQHGYAHNAVAYINHGAGSLEAAVEHVRSVHQAQEARSQRREQLTTLMSGEGLNLVDWQHRVPGMHAFLVSGTGSAEELVAQAKAFSQAADPPPCLQAYAV
ncbi:hypothetical protein ABPG75_008337 [Micractinium tetrahymenae]